MRNILLIILSILTFSFVTLNEPPHQLNNPSTPQLVNSTTPHPINSTTHQLLNSSTRQLLKKPTMKLALLKYSGGGDWYSNPTALPNLAKFCNDKLGTNLDPDYATVEVASADLFNYPFVHMTDTEMSYFRIQMPRICACIYWRVAFCISTTIMAWTPSCGLP